MKASLQKIAFTAKLWIWPGDNASWHFVSIPQSVAATLREKYTGQHKGWNSLPVEATVGETTWRTSMFYSTPSKTYLLPIKAAVRKKEALLADELVDVALTVL